MYKPGKNRQFVQEKPFWCTNWVNNGTIAPQRDGGGRQAVPSENLCHPRHHKRGTASAVVVERQRGFQGKPKQRSHRPEIAPQRDGGGR